MNWELDHVFVATSDADSAEAALTEFGLTFTERRVHRGQGTANACAMFDNAYFELLRAHDLAELGSDIVRPLGLGERIRWRETGACPFGLCFRPIDALSRPGDWPFETWRYEAAYVPPGTSIPIVTPRWSLKEPLVFVLNRPKSPPANVRANASPSHCGAPRMLTRVNVLRAETPPVSASVQWFVDRGLFSLGVGSEFLLDLEWDHGRAANSRVFLPSLPITVRW
ncbi:MAG: VOC family protein [Myxococcales bacterium]|nr:VOC family protein [Myxococcales bacterium]